MISLKLVKCQGETITDYSDCNEKTKSNKIDNYVVGFQLFIYGIARKHIVSIERIKEIKINWHLIGAPCTLQREASVVEEAMIDSTTGT